MTPEPSTLPQCWGHRGASAAYPENSLMSFAAAIADGVEGIESDVHITSDDIVLCIHDPSLDRTTSGNGLVKHQPYRDGIDRLVTVKTPAQPVPTFEQTIQLLARPENQHVCFNIDVKLDNQPERIFTLMRKTLDAEPNFDMKRVLLGLWHPSFVEPAKRILPECGIIHIGMSVALARTYFFEHCTGFSMAFASLVGRDGELFRKECKTAGKRLYVWTVNKRPEMIEATKWGVDAILTDRTNDLVKLRKEMKTDWSAVSRETTRLLPWTSLSYFTPYQFVYTSWQQFVMQSHAGPFVVPSIPPIAPVSIRA